MRAFFCVPLKPDVASAIDRVARGVRDATDMQAGWVRRENYHVTLRFLGEIDPLLTVDLDKISRRVTARLEPLVLSLDRLGCFPSIDRARVLWIGGDASPAFRGLAASLHHELRGLDFPPERKPTVAHVTLARIKGRPDAGLSRVLADADLPRELEARVDRIALMESVLSHDGAVYTPLFTTPFRGRGSDAD